MIVSKIPERVDVPHEPGEWFEIWRVPWKKLKRARKITEAENRDIAKAFGPAFIKAFQSEDGVEKGEQLIRRQRYDESNFDTAILLEYGVAGWSYMQDVVTEGGAVALEKVSVSSEALGELDEQTAAWAKQAIIDLTRPRTENEEKNSSGSSTESSTKS